MNEQQFNALPEEQRKAEQKRLQAIGLYPAGARLDGKWGPGTDAAYSLEDKRAAEDAKGARDAELERQRLDIERIRAQTGAQTSAAANQATEAETARLNEYNRQSSSPEGIATKIGATGGAPIAGLVVGREMGKGTNALMDMAQRSRNETLAGVAADRRAGLTTREGAIGAATRAGAMPYTNAPARVASRMAPHLGLGAFALGKGALTLSQGSDKEGFYPEMANRGIGLGWIGAGSGLAEQGIRYAASPGVAPDAQSLAVINSSQLRRNNEPAPKGPAAGTLAALREEAKALNIPGRSKLTTKGALSAAIENVKQGTKSIGKAGVLGPALAAGTAYLATPDRAEAATGEGTAPSSSEALTNAGVAGGLAYGVGKAIPRAAMPIVGGMAAPVAAMTFDPLEGASREETQRNIDTARGEVSYYAPGLSAAFGIPRSEGTAYDITQNPGNLPTPSPMRPAPGNQNFPLSSRLMPLNGGGAGGGEGGRIDFQQALAEFQALLNQQAAQ